jgi:hypothetical protein
LLNQAARVRAFASYKVPILQPTSSNLAASAHCVPRRGLGHDVAGPWARALGVIAEAVR